jgi:hypothetical protein
MTPDPKTLYAVTALVFAGLTVWLLMVLRNVKEPWAKPVAQAPMKLKVPADAPGVEDEEQDEDDEDHAKKEDGASKS